MSRHICSFFERAGRRHTHYAVRNFLIKVPAVEITAIGAERQPSGAWQALHETVVALPGVARYLSSPLRWPKPDDDYKNNVNTVLQR